MICLYMLYHEVYTCLQVKCVQYWPDAVGRSQTYGPFSICLTEEQEFADYVVRTIELKVCTTIYVFVGVAALMCYRILCWVTVYMW